MERFNKNYLITTRQTKSEKKILRNAIILVQGHRLIDKGERFGDKDPSTETKCRESSYSHPMKYMSYGVEDFHCQDRGRTMNIFTWISSTYDGYCKDTALNEANYSPKKRRPLREKLNESLFKESSSVCHHGSSQYSY